MIRLATPEELGEQKRLEAFARAVTKGATIFAGPETARRINEAIESQGWSMRVREHQYIEEGSVYAMDFQSFGFGGR